MHLRHRSTGEPFRPAGPAGGGVDGGYFATSARRSFGRRKFSSPKPQRHNNHHAPPPPPPPPPPRKADAIFFEAGRLAAEYLVSKGLIPESLLPYPPRASAISRLRFDNIVGSEYRGKQFVKSHRRPGPYDRSYSFSRENGRDRMSCDDENDDGYDEDGEATPGFSKSGKMEMVGESANDSASKVSSSSTRRDTQIETEVNSTKDHSGEDNGENGENGDVDMRSSAEGDEETGGDRGHDLLKFLTVSKVPTRPRSSSASAQRNMKTLEEPSAEEKSNVSEVVSGDLQNSVGDETKAEDNNVTDPDEQDNNVTDPDEQPMQQDVEKQHESSEVAPAVEEEENLAINSSNEEEKETVKENGYSMNNSGGEMLNQYDGKMTEKNPVIIVSELSDKIEVEDKRQLLHTSFKILDLNLMECPDMNEVHDDPASHHLTAATSTIGDRKEHSPGFSLSLVNSIDSADKFSKLPGTEKVVPIIDLEDDSPGVALGRRRPGPQGSSIYHDMNPVLNRTEHPIELHSMQDNYNLIAPVLLGNDISGCSTVQPDLNNLQTGYGLPGAEVFAGDDIYESFGGLPMGFMEVWDPPPQEYGNFF